MDSFDLFFLTEVENPGIFSSWGCFLETLGNYSLKPVRYFGDGHFYRLLKKGSDYHVNNMPEKAYPDYTRTFIKTVEMIVAFIPGVLLGTCLKGLSFSFEDVRTRNFKVLEEREDIPASNEKEQDDIKLKLANKEEVSEYANTDTLDMYSVSNIDINYLFIISSQATKGKTIKYAFDLNKGSTDLAYLQQTFSSESPINPYTNEPLTVKDKENFIKKLKSLDVEPLETGKLENLTFFQEDLQETSIEAGLALATIFCTDKSPFSKSQDALEGFVKEHLIDTNLRLMPIYGIKSIASLDERARAITVLSELIDAVNGRQICVEIAGILIYRNFQKYSKISKEPKEISSLAKEFKVNKF